MYYSEDHECFFRDDGYQFAPAKKDHYENFGFFLSEQDGKIYFVDNDSDKAISRILRCHRNHSNDFGLANNPDPLSDNELKSLLPEEVQEELISSDSIMFATRNCWGMWFFAKKKNRKKTWEFLQEKGSKLRHFKTSRCVKQSDIC